MKLALVLFCLPVQLLFAQVVTIPDPVFKSALVNHTPVIDTNGDGEIQVSEAQATLTMMVDFKNISSMEGIEAFVNLQFLRCNDNSLTSLDLSANTALEFVYAYINDLTMIDVSGCVNLKVLDVSNNNLGSLDISNNGELEILRCHVNELSALDLSANPDLTDLICYNNEIVDLSLSLNPSLELLQCESNLFYTLDLSLNGVLQELRCNDNPNLQNLNVANGNNGTITEMWAYDAPNLFCIEVDDVANANTAPGWIKDAQAAYSEQCELGLRDERLPVIMVYPNPVSNVLSVDGDDIDKVRIYDMNLRLLLESVTTPVDISAFSEAMYIVEVKSGSRKYIYQVIKE